MLLFGKNLKFEKISKILFKILKGFNKKLKKILIFFLLSKLILGWYFGCTPSFANFLGFGEVGRGTFPLFPSGDATGLLWYWPFVHKSSLIITRLQIIFFYFYLNIPIPYARKIFKIFPYFFTLTKQLF